MDLGSTIIEMGQDEAQEQLESYRTLRAPNDEEKAVIAGLMALAAGKPLLNVRDTIREGGVFESGLPRLAFMDASRLWCYCGRSNSGRVTFSHATRINGTMTKAIYELPAGTLDEQVISDWGITSMSNFRYRSQVPIVPPQHRPARFNASNFVILWEVEEWAVAPRPPGDPALLRHVTGDLYSVEAIWDLTPLERAVLGARGVL
jgi:hypothetical protein